MKSAKLSSIMALGLLALLQSLPVSAHFIWLEQADGQTKLYFGEYEGGLREKTGGRLDTIATPEAMTPDNKALTVATKRADDFIVIEGANNQPVIAHEFGMKVKDLSKYYYGIVKPMYYARIGTGHAEAAISHALDIQPLGNNKVRVHLNGKPLAKAKLKVLAPNQWLQELDADGNGEATFSMPWAGLYVLEVVYLEPNKGTYQNEAYENIRHVSTLSVVKK
ncbi:MAG: DUF4198 domain-containing protein [Methylotenera sp.]|nr:DUF4198 domain-containing protein [Methylotenera sp.]